MKCINRVGTRDWLVHVVAQCCAAFGLYGINASHNVNMYLTYKHSLPKK